MFTTSYASSDPTPAVSAIGGCAAVPWATATTDLSPQRGFSASDAAPAEGWCDPVDTALGNVVSRLEDIERRRRELEAEHLEALHEAFDIAAAESENAYALYPSGKSGELAYRAVRAEVAAALQMSERTVEKHIAHAYTVRNNYAATLTALREGRISVRHVQTITDAGLIIGGGDDPGSVTRRADYEARALRVAERDTPTRAKPILRRIAEEYAEVSLEERYETAKRERRVWVEDCDNGMAILTAYLTAVEAKQIYNRLTHTAKHVQRVTGERPGPTFTSASNDAAVSRPRSRDEIRADLFTDLLRDASFTLEALGRIADTADEPGRAHSGVEVQIITTADRLGCARVRRSCRPLRNRACHKRYPHRHWCGRNT